MEVAESNFCLQLQFEYHASGPLVYHDLQAKQVLDIVQSWDVVFSSDTSTYRFTGKPVSQTTGLYYDYQRWYDPSIGRFVSQDPLAGRLSNPQTLNPYVYAGNTPTTYADPTGQFFILDTLIGAAVGAGVGYGWCVAATGGWTSSGCGEYALLGAGTGALAGTTWGLSLALEAGCEAEGCIPPDPTTTTDPTTTCLCPDTPTPTASTTDPVPTVTTSAETTPTISNVARGNLGVDASIQDLGANFVGREVPVSSETFGNGRIDIYSNGPKSFIESKNVQNLYLTQENRLQLWKYEDAVGAENLQYDLRVNFVHPDFISELDRLNVAYRILPYIPSL
jgi:RHS repeat-associated protein